MRLSGDARWSGTCTAKLCEDVKKMTLCDRIIALIKEKRDKYHSDMEGADHDDFIKADFARCAMHQLLIEARAMKDNEH